MAAICAFIYGAMLVLFPRWEADLYHVAALFLIAGAVFGASVLSHAMSLYRGREAVLELLLFALVLLTVAWTLPQSGGKTPLELLREGYRPKQADIRDGFMRLGVKPASPPANWVIQRFPN
jgi:hypothetical protein